MHCKTMDGGGGTHGPALPDDGNPRPLHAQAPKYYGGCSPEKAQATRSLRVAYAHLAATSISLEWDVCTGQCAGSL